MAKELPNLHRIEELATRKAQDTIYQRLRALAEPVDVAGREGVMWGDVECLFAELRGERQGVVHASIRSTKTASLPPTMPRGEQPSSEPEWIHVMDKSDRDWKPISIYELRKIEHAINENEPGHLRELHDQGNETVDKVRARESISPFGSVGARGGEAARGVGSESLEEKESPAATSLTTNCPECKTPMIEFSNTMMRQLDRCPRWRVEAMTRKWNLALTYEPKIQPVRDGTCRQTIRPIGKGPAKQVGDLISFHGWQGRPYHSSWSWRTPYTPITIAKSCLIRDEGIDNLKFQGEFGLWDWEELDALAEIDGIVPPTGIALRDVLMSKNKIPAIGIEAQIIRW
jgi:hypothetical protein